MIHKDDIIASRNIVIDVFRSFRDELRAVTGNVVFERKKDFSPVTKWDVAVETKLKTALAAAFPQIGFIGEETGASGSSDAYWIVDPIDGTSSFIRGLDYSTNMAAYIEDGVVKSAVIYDFVRDNLFTATVGGGAFKDGERITVNSDRREGDLVLYSFSRDTFSPLREATRELGMRLLLPMGSAGHTFALLAEGKIDGIVALGTNMGFHDIAPGLLLASEAGAEVLAYDNEVISREFIIGTPYVTEQIEHSGLI